MNEIIINYVTKTVSKYHLKCFYHKCLDCFCWEALTPHFGPHGNLAGCLSLPLYLSPSQEASYCFSTAHKNMNHSKSVHLETGNTFEAQGIRGFLLSAFTMSFSRTPQTLNRPREVVNHPSLQSLWIPGTREHHWQMSLSWAHPYAGWTIGSNRAKFWESLICFHYLGLRDQQVWQKVPSSMELSCRTLFYLIILLRHVSLCRSGWS